MKTSFTKLPKALRTGLLAAGLIAVLGGAVAPAFADEDDWHRGDRDRHEHEWRDRDGWRDRDAWRDRDDRGSYAAPGTYYYPPGYGYGYGYAPAPTYAAPGFSLGFVFR